MLQLVDLGREVRQRRLKPIIAIPTTIQRGGAALAEVELFERVLRAAEGLVHRLGARRGERSVGRLEGRVARHHAAQLREQDVLSQPLHVVLGGAADSGRDRLEVTEVEGFADGRLGHRRERRVERGREELELRGLAPQIAPEPRDVLVRDARHPRRAHCAALLASAALASAVAAARATHQIVRRRASVDRDHFGQQLAAVHAFPTATAVSAASFPTAAARCVPHVVSDGQRRADVVRVPNALLRAHAVVERRRDEDRVALSAVRAVRVVRVFDDRGVEPARVARDGHEDGIAHLEPARHARVVGGLPACRLGEQ